MIILEVKPEEEAGKIERSQINKEEKFPGLHPQCQELVVPHTRTAQTTTIITSKQCTICLSANNYQDY